MMILIIFLAIVTLILIIRFLSKTSFLHMVSNKYRSFEDWFHIYQSYKIPQHKENLQENLLYHKVLTYLNSLASLEDTQFTNLFTGSKSNDIILNLDADQTVVDTFLGARVSWTNKKETETTNTFILRLKKKDKRRILRPYLQHVFAVADENEQKKKEIRLYMNLDNGRWRSIPFTHPATMDTVILDNDVKIKVMSDLELFLKSKQYYNKLGRVWKRSYLLYGPSGTGKSTFVAAMARFLCYDVYDIDLSTVSDDSDLKTLLLQTKSKSLILVEGFDKFFKSSTTTAGLFSFMDGIMSCCGEERVMVFTMNVKKDLIDDQTVMRPGMIDVHVQFPLCDFSTFKMLANNYLGVKEHKLFGQVEEGFQNGSSMSPAQIGELMISNRTSPTRALKSVITALQNNEGDRNNNNKQQQEVEKIGARSGENGSGNEDGLLCRESVHTVREFRKLYGLLRGSRRKEESPLDLSSIEKSGSRHDQS